MLNIAGAPASTYAQATYSIEAEDIMVERIFYHMVGHDQGYNGFYVDLGACDPERASNTCRLYHRGWRGLNIEANPAALPRFEALRPRDTSLNVAVGEEGNSGRYASFEEPLLNGFLNDDVIDFHVGRGVKLLSRTDVGMRSVNRLLEENVPTGVVVDYLNIDIETMEIRILSDLDFSRWSPKVISIEIHGPNDILSIAKTPIATLLMDRGYTFVSRLWHTSIFARLSQ